MSINLVPVEIHGETFHADVVGVIRPTENAAAILGCLGIIGRRAGLGRALALLNDGFGLYINQKATSQLGKKRYRALQIPMGKGVQRLFLLPSSELVIDHDKLAKTPPASSVSDEEGEQEGTEHYNVLVWRGDGHGNQVAWRAIQQASNIPLLDAWGPVLMPLLADADHLDQIRIAAGLPPRGVSRFRPMEFLANVDGRFQGGLINIDEKDLIVAVRHGFQEGAIAA